MINILSKALILLLLILPLYGESKGTILILGDSLTAGFGVDQEQAFPQLIKDKLDSRKLNFAVLNGGVSGNTSAGGIRRVNWYFKRQIDILVLALGANDGLRGLPVKSTEENLQKIIELARKKNSKIKIIIAGMLVPPNMGKEYSTSFKTLFPRLAKKNNCLLIPFLLENVAGLKDYNQADGIHPNPQGHKEIAKNVLKTLDKAISTLK
jgi:acyl-CoA thioesterase-1